MTQQLTILNNKDIKKIKELAISQFGYFPEKDYVFLKSEKDKLFIINKDISKLKLENLKIDRIGLYFAEYKNNQFRLSKEGAQLLGQAGGKKLKSVVELNESEVKEYFTGVDLDYDLGPENKLVLLKYKDDILGCAKYKDHKILNFLPKIHRGEVIL